MQEHAKVFKDKIVQTVVQKYVKPSETGRNKGRENVRRKEKRERENLVEVGERVLFLINTV